MAYPKAPFVVVYWRDHSADGGWVDDDYIQNAEGELCKAYGLLVRQDAEMTIVIGAAHADDGKGNIQEIMTGCVEKIVRAKETGSEIRVKR